jgi:hypothetical protein
MKQTTDQRFGHGKSLDARSAGPIVVETLGGLCHKMNTVTISRTSSDHCERKCCPLATHK